MPIHFAKYSGCGNDFILVDNRFLHLAPSINAIKTICHRHKGIGADGLILLETSSSTAPSYRMRIYNCNGSEAEMCGNGLRCLANFIRHIDKVAHPLMIQTIHHEMEVFFDGELVTIKMPPSLPVIAKTLSIDNKMIPLYCLNTGVPHAVHFVNHLEDDKEFKLGPNIRFHEEFLPHGTNVNYAQITSDQCVSIRTYERGVERETQACGTGAVAVAIISAQVYALKSPITIKTCSEENLFIHFKKNHSEITDLTLTGSAVKIFEGFIEKQIFFI